MSARSAASAGPAGGAEVYCVCRQPYTAQLFMIECENCRDWFHGR